MLSSAVETFRALSRNEQIGFSINIIGIMVGFITSQFSIVAGAIIFSSFLLIFVFVTIYALYSRDNYGGIYEALEYEDEWEFLDDIGKLATHTKRVKARFIQNNVIAIHDYIWGDGEIMIDYKCNVGIIADNYSYGTRKNVLISLRDIKQRGEELDLELSRKVKDGFLQPSEWIQVAVLYKTKHMTMRVIFPQSRPCKRVNLINNSGTLKREVSRNEIIGLPDGRQMIQLHFNNPKMNETYTLQWDW